MKYFRYDEMSKNEKIKKLLLFIILFYILSHFGKEKSIEGIIYDLDNIPNKKENLIILKVKEDLVSDINLTKKIDSIRKIKIISIINNIKFISVDKEELETISNEKEIMACYFRHYNKRSEEVRFIIIDKDKLNSLGVNSVIIHELRHLVDDVLYDDIDKYSEFINIENILDKDIVLRTPKGEKKLKEKIDIYTKLLVRITINSTNDKKILSKVENEFKDELIKLFNDKRNNDYITSPEEIYVRFHGLKKWMVKKGYLKDINDEITQDKIIKVLNDKSIIEEHNKYNLDFFELLFYLDFDFSGKTKKDMTKINSIV